MEHYSDPNLKIFALSSNRPLAAKIAEEIGLELGQVSVTQFSDGEIKINIDESVRGCHVYIVQSTSFPVNDNLMELLIMVDALRRASAKTINIVIPYYGYARQDRKAQSREPITAKLVANMITQAGADRVLGQVSVTQFSDGEIKINIDESVRGCHVYIVQSTSFPVNDNLMELLIMVDALRRASAKTINIVIPYYGYARQDRKAQSREPITAKLVANMITQAGADRVLTLDLHAAQIQGFFDIPVDHLLGAPLLANHFLENNFKDKDIVVVSPDHGGVTRARKMAEFLHAPIAIVDKRRPKANVAEVMNIIGEVKGKVAVLIDDMIDTAGTITLAAQAIKDAGALEVYACCTHAVLSGPALDRINDSVIKEVVVTDSIEVPEEKTGGKIVQISVDQLMAEAIRRIHENRSVSPLFIEKFTILD